MRTFKPFWISLLHLWPPYLFVLSNLFMTYLYTHSLSQHLIDFGFTELSFSQVISSLMDFTVLPVVLCAQMLYLYNAEHHFSLFQFLLLKGVSRTRLLLERFFSQALALTFQFCLTTLTATVCWYFVCEQSAPLESVRLLAYLVLCLLIYLSHFSLLIILHVVTGSERLGSILLSFFFIAHKFHLFGLPLKVAWNPLTYAEQWLWSPDPWPFTRYFGGALALFFILLSITFALLRHKDLSRCFY